MNVDEGHLRGYPDRLDGGGGVPLALVGPLPSPADLNVPQHRPKGERHVDGHKNGHRNHRSGWQCLIIDEIDLRYRVVYFVQEIFFLPKMELQGNSRKRFFPI